MIKRPKLIWKLFPSYVVIIIVSVGLMIWSGAEIFEEFSFNQTAVELKSQSSLVAERLEQEPRRLRQGDLNDMVRKLGALIRSRVTVIDPSGAVLADTDENPDAMDNHADRPEVRWALTGESAVSRRYSATLDKSMVYVAVAIKSRGEVIGVVRTSKSAADISRTLNQVYLQLALEGLIIAALAALVCLYVSHRINQPLAKLRRGADKFAAGRLDYRLEMPDTEEPAALAAAMNSMAAQLAQRIETVTLQRNELEAVLEGMSEAVIVVAVDERLTHVNRAAAELFGLDRRQAAGKTLLEAVRHTELRRFVSDCLWHGDHHEAEITLEGPSQIFLQAHAAPLIVGRDRSIVGAVVVLNDVTRLKRLENMRREFVANVSHELKTPVTSIKGFLETLREGAVYEQENAIRFLDITIKHTDRLSMIIEDLLSLSRIEREAEAGTLKRTLSPLEPVIRAAAATCLDLADEREVQIDVQCAHALDAYMNENLIEQAVANLLANAIKFSDPGGKVVVEGSCADGNTLLTVSDTGCGISASHLPRIFERFYRVEKSRSRAGGGTGLGLAIVKHIVEAHSGEISVKSAVGKGTTFTILLPYAQIAGEAC